jgi:hypothetical protein
LLLLSMCLRVCSISMDKLCLFRLHVCSIHAFGSARVNFVSFLVSFSRFIYNSIKDTLGILLLSNFSLYNPQLELKKRKVLQQSTNKKPEVRVALKSLQSNDLLFESEHGCIETFTKTVGLLKKYIHTYIHTYIHHKYFTYTYRKHISPTWNEIARYYTYTCIQGYIHTYIHTYMRIHFVDYMSLYVGQERTYTLVSDLYNTILALNVSGEESDEMRNRCFCYLYNDVDICVFFCASVLFLFVFCFYCLLVQSKSSSSIYHIMSSSTV